MRQATTVNQCLVLLRILPTKAYCSWRIENMGIAIIFNLTYRKLRRCSNIKRMQKETKLDLFIN